MTAHILQESLNADHSDYHGPAMRCDCGEIASYYGRRSKTILSVIGELTLERAYYYCAICQKGFCPRDKELGLEHDSLSSGLLKMVGVTAALVSFQETDELLHELAGINVGVKHVERAAEKLGDVISCHEKEVIITTAPTTSTMYLGLDGTGIPMRPEALLGRQGKQSDGSSKTREVKLVTIWTAASCDDQGIYVRDKGSISYNAAIESAASDDTEHYSAFAKRVERGAERRGFNHVKRQVIIGDGAKWIWNIATDQFPEAIQIVDLYHAKGTISSVAKAIFGVESEQGKIIAKKWRDMVEEAKTNELICELSSYYEKKPEVKSCIKYLETNRHRMTYPLFHQKGLCTSSGVVEAGCKLAIGTRLKRAGMHWTVEGANAIIALRCCKLSEQYENYWNTRLAS